MLSLIAALVCIQDHPLDEIQRLMSRAEEQLNDRALDGTQRTQRDVIERLNAIIRQARASSGGSGNRPARDFGTPPTPGSGADRTYTPDRTAQPDSVFRSRNGDAVMQLPPRIREAMLHARRDIDDYPADYAQLLSEYFKTLSGERP